MASHDIWPGKPCPLGATWDGNGTNFALFSENAERVELLLYEAADSPRPAAVIPLRENTAMVWHGYLPGTGPPQLYAYRVHGPYKPEEGFRFNTAKALIDPYAKAIAGTVLWNDTLFGYKIGDPKADLSKDTRDSGKFIPKGVVIDPTFDWEGDQRPLIPWNETIIYEVHVKGLTFLHPQVEGRKRGTYAGLASPAMIDYLQSLGITAIELLPIHQHVDDRVLVDKALTNYWGYNTIGYFSPDCRYSSAGFMGEQVREFKEMVKALHKAGIEIILDVVYNHTAEGNHLGPTLSFKGIDNRAYYRLNAKQQRHYMDFTGTGNTLNMAHPHVTQLIMDSLRYWVLEMHVDGFRFDLAATLARELFEVDHLSAFFDIIHQEPVLSQTKLIAEPWDLGEGGYQVGNFPPLWAEWNGKYRDTIRRFWKGDESQMAELGYRLAGSSDLYGSGGRKPYASTNFVTCHDGLTLRDIVSYNEKHNAANKEGNKDGATDNMSWNCGHEGPTSDPAINALRLRQQKNFLVTLFVSQGVPMLLGGDEISRSQNGNNNTYCQDNNLSWFDWTLDETAEDMLEFTRMLIRLRRDHPVFRRKKFLQGRKIYGADFKDITWLKPNGQEMTEDDWTLSYVRTIGLLLAGDAIDELTARGERIVDDTFLVLLNAHHEKIKFKLPAADKPWQLLVYTPRPLTQKTEMVFPGGWMFAVEGRSLALFMKPRSH